MKAVLVARFDLLLLVALQLLFVFAPQLDLLVTSWFYRPGEGFFLADQPLVQWSYQVFAQLHFYVVAVLAWLLLASWLWRRRSERLLRRRLWFLLLVLALGPGLLVNEVFKAESGRARPVQVEQYGGAREFTPVFTPAEQCERNCSFVSGHAAMGFFFIALAWVLRDRRWLWFGILLGALVGLGRMVEGKHFLSDVIFSYWVVYGVCVLLAFWLLGQKGITRCIASGDPPRRG
jgi:lipid A 4'-phosphatase